MAMAFPAGLDLQRSARGRFWRFRRCNQAGAGLFIRLNTDTSGEAAATFPTNQPEGVFEVGVVG